MYALLELSPLESCAIRSFGRTAAKWKRIETFDNGGGCR
jgi:hypothetical protein